MYDQGKAQKRSEETLRLHLILPFILLQMLSQTEYNRNSFIQPANQLACITTFSKVLDVILKIQSKHGQGP